jgi:hypothetical protein
MRSLALVLLAARVASAHPLPEIAEPEGWRETPAALEWSTWFRLGFGVQATPIDALARSTMPVGPRADQHTTWSTSLGADVSLPLGDAVRLGPWVALEDGEPAAGGELLVTRAPSHLDMFFYDGEGVWAVRAGRGTRHAIASLGWGYRCPWRLWGPYSRATRYEIGARIVLATSYASSRDWTGTLGIEVEPVGALRYLLGIKSLY